MSLHSHQSSFPAIYSYLIAILFYVINSKKEASNMFVADNASPL
jgi:hypothetical protein